MSPTNFAQQERAALCDLFEEVGPDQPTLCEGWTTRDLAAHLIVRERRPDTALGIIASPFERHSEKVRLATAEQPWKRLIALVRSGPPKLSLFGPAPIDRAANTMEFFIHHEDVRRGQQGWEPRELDPELSDEIWKNVRRMSKLMLRKAPAGLTLSIPGGEPVVAHAGDPMVSVTAAPGELALFAFGRQHDARLEVDGPSSAVEQVMDASFGI
ncbi:TIGR03085 family metal-binding protein [soil metagenome]